MVQNSKKISSDCYFKSFKMLIFKISFILDDIFYGPVIRRIEKFFVKICPKFLDLYASIYGNNYSDNVTRFSLKKNLIFCFFQALFRVHPLLFWAQSYKIFRRVFRRLAPITWLS